MNLESWQEVNCSLIGPQNEEDGKELKRKLWTNPAELVKTWDGAQTTQQQEVTPGIRPELVPGNGEQSELRGERRVSPTGDPQPPGENDVAGHDPLRPLHLSTRMEDDSGGLPPLDPREREGQKKTAPQEAQGENLPAPPIAGIDPSSTEDPYRHSWDRERGRNYSSSEEEDGLQVLGRAWARHESPQHMTSMPSYSPLQRHEPAPTSSHTQGTARHRTPHHSTPRRRRYHQDVSPADPQCERRTRSLEPSLARAQQETQWEGARSASSESLHWTPLPRGRTYHCPSASGQIRQTQTRTTTAWSHVPQ